MENMTMSKTETISGPISDLTLEEAHFTAKVTGKERAADDVILLTLQHVDGEDLPPWRPGAHIDLVLANGLTRQYSLCGDPEDLSRYVVGVLNAPNSRGGSAYIHESLSTGDTVTVRGPRNHFRLLDAPSYLFLAGGIGITPIAAMIREVHGLGKPWTLVYGGRTLSSMAFRDEFAAHGPRTTLWPQDTKGIIDLATVLGSPDARTAVYTCGPEPLLAAVEAICSEQWPAGTLHLERFTAKKVDTARDVGFEIELATSGLRLTVPADKSVLHVLEESGTRVLSSCGEGTCGTCETPVIDGTIDHRDSVLTPEEKNENSCMMVCVSRATCALLVLDL
jgi:ferredoxin-NADP reductase